MLMKMLHRGAGPSNQKDARGSRDGQKDTARGEQLKDTRSRHLPRSRSRSRSRSPQQMHSRPSKRERELQRERESEQAQQEHTRPSKRERGRMREEDSRKRAREEANEKEEQKKRVESKERGRGAVKGSRDPSVDSRGAGRPRRGVPHSPPPLADHYARDGGGRRQGSPIPRGKSGSLQGVKFTPPQEDGAPRGNGGGSGGGRSHGWERGRSPGATPPESSRSRGQLLRSPPPQEDGGPRGNGGPGGGTRRRGDSPTPRGAPSNQTYSAEDVPNVRSEVRGAKRASPDMVTSPESLRRDGSGFVRKNAELGGFQGPRDIGGRGSTPSPRGKRERSPWKSPPDLEEDIMAGKRGRIGSSALISACPFLFFAV